MVGARIERYALQSTEVLGQKFRERTWVEQTMFEGNGESCHQVRYKVGEGVSDQCCAVSAFQA